MAEWGSDDMIGASFYSNWADSIIKVERRGNDRLQVKFDVIRHAEEELEPIEVDFNRDTLMLSVVQPNLIIPETSKVTVITKEEQASGTSVQA